MGSSRLTVSADDGAMSRLRADLEEVRAALEQSNADRRRLAGLAAQAAEEERRRLAQTLHDTVSQSLTGIYLQAQVIAKNLQNSGSDKTREVAELAEMIRGTVIELTNIARGLQPEGKSALDIASDQSDSPDSPPPTSGTRPR